jgi:TRAP-type mannitol/chloroaromatic compound transport system permease small subunit
MNPFLFFVDSLSAWMGKAFGWCIMLLTFATCYEVFVRYILNAPTVWAFDMSVQMYGALFMMAGAYTLSRNGHVRGDVLHRLLPPRGQAGIDLALYILFLLPGVFALIWYGYEFAADSWRYKEVSWSSPARVQIYFFKTLIPVAGFLVLLQGIAEAWRCVICLRTGEWPARLHDVEETETMLLHQHEDEKKLLHEEDKKIKMHADLKKIHEEDLTGTPQKDNDRGEDK